MHYKVKLPRLSGRFWPAVTCQSAGSHGSLQLRLCSVLAVVEAVIFSSSCRRLFLRFSTAWWLLYFNIFLAAFVHHAYNEQQHVHVDSADYFAVQLSQQLVNFEFYIDRQSPASTSTSTSTVTPASPSFLTASSVDNNTLSQAI